MALMSKRRGGAVLAAVVLLAMINLLMVASVRPAGEESLIGESRLLSLRALHAAESGVRIVAGTLISGGEVPEAGAIATLGSASVEFVSVPPVGEPGEIVVKGRAGQARRALSVIVR